MARTTLADIAERSGVTVPTVSKVINGRQDVAPETRARVLKAMDEIGYQRKARSSERTAKQSGFVDLVLNPIGRSWAAEVVMSVQRAVAELDCEVIVSYPEEDGSPWADRAIRRGSRGVILERFGVSVADAARLERAQIPVVMIDPGTTPPPSVFSVSSANWSGGHLAADHLVRLGHREIALVHGGTQFLTSSARVDGFHSRLAESGIEVPPHWVIQADWTRSGACKAVERVMSSSERPTAIFACSDRMAAGVMLAARERGIRIPEDLSVIGFDDMPESLWLTPQLTTIRQPVADMGRTAVQLISAKASRSAIQSRKIELSTSLIVRASTSARP